MSRTTSAANGGRIAAELRNWARGCHSTEATVELLIRARGGKFVAPVSHGCGPTTRNHLARPEVIGGTRMRLLRRASHFGTRRSPRIGKPLEDVGGLMASLTPTISVSSLPSYGCRQWTAGRHLIPQKTPPARIAPPTFPAGPWRVVGCLPRSSQPGPIDGLGVDHEDDRR